MKFKLTVLLAAVVVAMGLLPGTSAEISANFWTLAMEGDTLADDTTLSQIHLDGGVASGLGGQSRNAAFAGKDGDSIDAAFISDLSLGVILAVKEGDELADGNTLARFKPLGEVATAGEGLIGTPQRPGGTVAFHGEIENGDNDIDAVFTQFGVVATEGDALENGILDQIDDEGKVAINNFGQVAFHGQFSLLAPIVGPEKRRAVFISDEQTTQVAVKEGDTLPDDDNTIVEEINEGGGVAINDFDEVAFHGRVVDPGSEGGDTLKAVFTTDGLAAREASELPDGTTLDDINEEGGVAINLFGDVAFHGSVIVPDAGPDAVKAVLTQNGVIAREGYPLADGTILGEIEVNGGVAININGDVVFHGRTDDGVKAVFTQNGVAAMVGQIGIDNNRLDDIHDNAGVSISPYFSDVAFHGKVGSKDAVFQGSVPAPPSGVFWVFVTRETYNGALGGLDGADAKCQDAALTVNLPGTWVAWLSDDNTDARDRIRDGQYELIPPVRDIVAVDLADLTDGSLAAPIRVDEDAFPNGTSVWTGTQTDGTRTGSTCSGWTTVADSAQATFGVSDFADEKWTDDDEGPQSCDEERSLYCFSLTDAPN